MTCLTGFDGQLCYNHKADIILPSAGSGTDAAPDWVAVKQLKDASLTLNTDKIDDSDRADVFKKYCAGQIDLELTCTMSYRDEDEVNNLKNAHQNRQTIHIALADGDLEGAVVGTEYFTFYAKVTSLDWDQSMNDVMMFDVTFTPTYYHDGTQVVVPTWDTV